MVVLLAISLRRHNPDADFVVFDYSEKPEVDASLEPWARELGFEVRKLRDDNLLRDPSYHNLVNMKWDAPLRYLETNARPGDLIHLDADMIVKAPIDRTVGRQYDALFLDYSEPGQDSVAISSFLVKLNLNSPKTRRLLALACSLNRDPYIWTHLKDMSHRKGAYPDSEMCMETAVRLLARDGYGTLPWADFDRSLYHYARHESARYPEIHAYAGRLLDDTGLASSYTNSFGDVRRIVYREADTTGPQTRD